MTKQEAMNEIRKGTPLYNLPKQFRTKEFVLTCYKNNVHFYMIGTHLSKCDFKLDYDIALARELYLAKYGPAQASLPHYSYSEHLTKAEIEKLIVTLELLK